MRTWKDIFGQQQAVDSLRQSYLADRLPHGLIFAGPIGVGKRTTADVLAQLFLCEQPKADQPCGVCGSCRIFGSGNHPDYHVITKELIRFHDKTGKSKGVDLSINVIRPELIEPASRKSSMGRGKVFIVEQADLMNGVAQNALLKTLEEPSGRTLLVLISEQVESLLPTVRSRCRIVRFAHLEEEVVRHELARREISEDLAATASALTRGSLGLALRWLEDGVVAAAVELVQQLDGLLAGRPLEDLAGWFKSAADAYAAKQLERDELSSKEQATREGLAVYLLIASEHLREGLSVTGQEHRLEAICDMIDALAQTERYLDSNVNVAVALQNLAISLETAAD